MLYSVTGVPANRTAWCGPGALCIITGLGYARALDFLKEERATRRPSLNRVVVKGTTNGEMKTVLARLGYDLIPIQVSQDTFAKWLRERSPEVRREVVLVCAGHHYMVVQGNRAADNIVREPRFISKMPGRRKRMENAWIVIRHDPAAQTKVLAQAEARQEKQAADQSVARREQRRVYHEVWSLVRKLGLTLKARNADGTMVIEPPEGFLLDGLSSLTFDGGWDWTDLLSHLQHWDGVGIRDCLTPDEEYD